MQTSQQRPVIALWVSTRAVQCEGPHTGPAAVFSNAETRGNGSSTKVYSLPARVPIYHPLIFPIVTTEAQTQVLDSGPIST